MFAVLKREFRSYFQNVIGWLFVAALMALFGLYFMCIISGRDIRICIIR